MALWRPYLRNDEYAILNTTKFSFRLWEYLDIKYVENGWYALDDSLTRSFVPTTAVSAEILRILWLHSGHRKWRDNRKAHIVQPRAWMKHKRARKPHRMVP